MHPDGSQTQVSVIESYLLDLKEYRWRSKWCRPMQLEASGERGISWNSKQTLVDTLRIIAIGNICPYT